MIILCPVNRCASDRDIFIAHEYHALRHTVCSCFSWILAVNAHKMWKIQRFLYARREVYEGRWGKDPLVNYEVGDGIHFYMIPVCYYSPSTSWSPVCLLPLLYCIHWWCLCNLLFCRDNAQFCARRDGLDPCDKMTDGWAKLCHQGR